MKTRKTSLLSLLIPAVLAAPSTADVVSSGFELQSTLPLPAVGTVHATLHDGRYFSFDGLAFELHARDGALLASLGSLPQFAYPSFALLDPTQSFALVGESSVGDLYRVALDGSGYQLVANVFFNYDAEFDFDPAFVWVSAAMGGFGQGNDIVRVELASGNVQPIAHVAGASGPLAVDAAGDLYYATSAYSSCPDLGSTDILRFDRTVLFSGGLLDESDASLFAADFDGASSLTYDPATERFFLAEANFCYAVGRIQALAPDGSRLFICAETQNSVSNIELLSDGGPELFHPYQPRGTTLRYDSTDFIAFTSDVLTIAPARARATISGPSSGPGQMTLTITGCEPNAGVYVFFGNVGFYQSNEIVYDFGFGFPLFFALPANKIRRIPLPIATDANGTAVFQYYDSGALHGQLVFQGLLIDGLGSPLGTCKAALN